ncbi:MAG: NACHT domain-containing protein [Anaerolineales bacterium]|nr:NACHT domain-containing protein [Anaerolineales bacterium]
MDAIDRHNRYAMIQRVKAYWLQGVLADSLHGADLIDINLAYRPEAVGATATDVSVAQKWQTAVYDTPIPTETSITELFEKANRELLLLGEPGAGKTTLLLHLVTSLLASAANDEQQPIPVVFNLSNWQIQQPLDKWLVAELSHTYEVPSELGAAWISNNQIILLLDGLDEVERDGREACVAAINQHHANQRGVALMVTARDHDYHELTKRLHLNQAVFLQPLTDSQIESYLVSRGLIGTDLQTVLQADSGLRELARSPLMLNIMALAYTQQSLDMTASPTNRKADRKRLFEVYVSQMLTYRSSEIAYQPEDSIRWLAWLAHRLSQTNRTMLFVENMQPNWLPRPQQRGYADRLKLIIGLACFLIGMLGGVLGVPAHGWSALIVGGSLGAFAAVWTALSGRLLVRSRANWYKIETVEMVSVSLTWVGLGFVVGALSGLLLGLLIGFLLNWLVGVTAVPWWLLCALWIGIDLAVEFSLVRGEVKMRTTPGEGIEYSKRYGVLISGVVVVVTAVLPLLLLGLLNMAGMGVNWSATTPWIISMGLYLGLMSGLAYGGLAALQHRRLLTVFCRDGVLPADPIHFWNYAAERSLLRKIGGGYTFIHALLLDYFKQISQSE